jgi:hypothetical protein
MKVSSLAHGMSFALAAYAVESGRRGSLRSSGTLAMNAARNGLPKRMSLRKVAMKYCKAGHPQNKKNTRIVTNGITDKKYKRCCICEKIYWTKPKNAKRKEANRQKRIAAETPGQRKARLEKRREYHQAHYEPHPLPPLEERVCKRGHKLTKENVYEWDKNRRCKTCMREYCRLYYRKNLA